MSWAGSFLDTEQPDWPARLDLPLVLSRRTLPIEQRRPRARIRWAMAPPVVLVVAGWRSSDPLRTTDGCCRSGPPEFVGGQAVCAVPPSGSIPCWRSSARR
jgi:hypothetical protein